MANHRSTGTSRPLVRAMRQLVLQGLPTTRTRTSLAACSATARPCGRKIPPLMFNRSRRSIPALRGTDPTSSAHEVPSNAFFRSEVITDHDWLRGEFITTVQKRGAAVIEARGSSSAASAANAVIDSVESIRTPTAPGDWVSLAVPSSGEYDVPEGLQFGYPVRSTGGGWEVVAGLEHDDLGRDRIRVTTEELLEERAEVAELLG